MTPRQKIDALVMQFTPEIRDAFLAAIADIVDNTILQAVIDAIERGDAVAAFEALGFSDAAMRPLTAALERAFEQGGVMVTSTFPRVGRAVFRFDVRNSRAEAWLRDHSSQLITRISEDARVNVMTTLETGMREGRNPRNVALDIIGRIDPGTKKRVGGVVGLSQHQETWVRSARAKLSAPVPDAAYFNMELRDKRFDRTVQAAIDAGKPLSQETVDKLLTRYKDNALRYRGESIARTEAIASLNQSEWEATKQTVDSGKVDASAVMREWDSAGDNRVRPSHRALNGMRVGLDEPFISPLSKARLMFPGDTKLGAPAKEVVACRCRVRTVVDWLHGVS